MVLAVRGGPRLLFVRDCHLSVLLPAASAATSTAMPWMTCSCRGPGPARRRVLARVPAVQEPPRTWTPTAWLRPAASYAGPMVPWRPAKHACRGSPWSGPVWQIRASPAGTAKCSAPSCRPMWPPARRRLVAVCGPGGRPAFAVSRWPQRLQKPLEDGVSGGGLRSGSVISQVLVEDLPGPGPKFEIHQTGQRPAHTIVGKTDLTVSLS